MKLRKIIAMLTACILLLHTGFAMAGLLPKADDTFSSVDMPTMRKVLLRDPAEEITLEDGTKQLTFSEVTKEEFDQFSDYIEKFGCSLVSYDTAGTVFTAVLEKDGKQMSFQYDYEAMIAIVKYPEGTDETEFDVAAYKAVLAKYATIGNVVTFGSYPQTEAGNDATPIEWIVLDTDGSNVLLISKYGLDAQPYNKEDTDVTWETCTLRAWLNNDFLNKAFTAEEQQVIITTTVENGQSQCYSGYDTNGGKNTEDKIFLLSYAEANLYFDIQYFEIDGASDNMKSRVEPTAYAIEQGAYASSDYKTAKGMPSGWWWLRSPGGLRSRATRVLSNGSHRSYYVNYDSGSVRPALWLNLESEAFSKYVETKNSSDKDEYSLTTSEIKAGDYITFGSYPQTAEGNDQTPIEWLVLDVEGSNVLLISKYGLDAQPYNKIWTDVSWETCTLRTWLNNDFLNKAFAAEEKNAIVTITVINKGSNNTQDKIFLLSHTEANQYFDVQHWKIDGADHNMKSRVEPTAYAIEQGAYTGSRYKTSEGGLSGLWWLRSPGSVQGDAAYVKTTGSLGYDIVNYGSVVVRPAFWLNLESEIF